MITPKMLRSVKLWRVNASATYIDDRESCPHSLPLRTAYSEKWCHGTDEEEYIMIRAKSTTNPQQDCEEWSLSPAGVTWISVKARQLKFDSNLSCSPSQLYYTACVRGA